MRETDWTGYKTAYGPADEVPDLLEALRSENDEEALHAADKLSGGLCHKGLIVSSSALPALPYILDVLEESCVSVQEELLTLLMGMTDCAEPDSAVVWERKLAETLRESSAPIETLLQSSNPAIREEAEELMELLYPPHQVEEAPQAKTEFEILLLAGLEQAIVALVSDGSVELESEQQPALLTELLEVALEARTPKAMIKVLLKTLIDSEHVLEVYATDQQLTTGFQLALS